MAKEMLWGYINKSGDMIITPQYHDATVFAGNHAFVKIDWQWFEIFPDGNLGPETEDHKVNDNPVPTPGAPVPVLIDSKFGYTDADGNIVIAPQYCEAAPFSDGLARVKKTPAGKWQYITPEGKLAFKSGFIQAKDFHNGLAPVLLKI